MRCGWCFLPLPTADDAAAAGSPAHGEGDIGHIRADAVDAPADQLGDPVGVVAGPYVDRQPGRVRQVDRRLVAAGFERELLERTVRRLDDLQDGERSRPALVETIFHPIPSVENRLDEAADAAPRPGYWDAARTAIFLGSTGLGLLGRAVHCNCGRPSLWVFLPSD